MSSRVVFFVSAYYTIIIISLQYGIYDLGYDIRFFQPYHAGKALLYDSSLGKIIGISKQNCPGDACF